MMPVRTIGRDYAQICKMADLRPNLTDVQLIIDDTMTPDMFNLVCGKWRKLETLRLDFQQTRAANFFESEKLAQYWSLPLVSLEVNKCRMGDAELIKIAKSFPRLEKLLLEETDVTTRGIDAITQLQSLRRLKLDLHPYGCQGMFEEARILARCPKLEEVEFTDEMMSVTVLTLIRFCPTLRFLRLFDIDDIDSAEAAGEMMRSMEGIRTRDFTLEFTNDFANENWDSEEVKNVLEEVNAANRCVIRIITHDPDICTVNENDVHT